MNENKPKIYSDPRLLRLGVLHGTASRGWGNMRDEANKNTLFNSLHIPPAQILRFHQTHSDRILTIQTPAQADTHRLQPLQEADGWIVSGAKLGALIITADCVPLFLWDQQSQLVGLAHCGWRGVAKGLPGKLAGQMLRLGAQKPISAWIGPHIQACCFEVQEDVQKQFPPDCVVYKNGKIFIDLTREILGQLTTAGLQASDINAPYHCTCGNRTEFFSYRRDHSQEALMSFIYRP